MVISTLVVVLIVFVAGSIALDYIYLRKLGHLQRVIFQSILLFCCLMALFSVTLLFYYEVVSDVYFGMIKLSLALSIIFGIGQYSAVKYTETKIERMREEYSQLPDGPKKQGMLRLLDDLDKNTKK